MMELTRKMNPVRKELSYGQIEITETGGSGLARQFGPDCEIVIHDLKTKDLEHSIVYLENGHVSGRQLGDGPSNVVLKALKETHPENLTDRAGYLTRTADGRVLKSSTFYIKDEARSFTTFSVLIMILPSFSP